MNYYQGYIGGVLANIGEPSLDEVIIYKNRKESSVNLNIEIFFNKEYKTEEEVIKVVKEWILRGLKFNLI